ncbi:hypothetical protein [Mucilaginibacter sp.]|uniref:DUF922 domain-containing protein n=1 Tax=Mucilaginibacter sp. TaxID=1882438 RepID=UPI0026340A54|nr:hypothetical protein [Mucilaginibacter sp.]
MEFRFVRVICITGLLFCVLNKASAQEGYHRLSLNDFRGAPRPDGDNSIAYTHCFIDYRYHVMAGNNHYNLSFDVKLVLDRSQSWLDRKRVQSRQMLTEIINHEQGHYIIAYMEQQEILRIANRTHFDANYQAEANALFNRIHTKYEQLTVNYDTDTRHMQDNVQQRSWDVYFKKRLTYMPPMEIADSGY